MAERTTRRQFLKVAAMGGASAWAACGGGRLQLPADGGEPGLDAGLPLDKPEALTESGAFMFGIASGDALADRVVLQTRYDGAAALRLRVWRMEGAVYAERVADAAVTPFDGGFVHLDVSGLVPGARYGYAFLEETAGQPPTRSALGRFRAALAPGQVEPLVFGAVSCTSLDSAPACLAHAAARTDLAAFLLLGDTTYNDTATTLAAYRTRWAQSLSRAEYRALRASTSLLATWDDHEVTNDFNPEQVPAARMTMARQTFFESLPLRRDALQADRLWKTVRWGDSVELFVLDGRGERKPSTRLSADPIYLSPTQLDWFKAGLKASPCALKLILNSVPISDFGFSAFNADGWRAYQKQRLEILKFIEAENIRGVLWLSGDHHFASAGTISASGPGTAAIEVLAGPGSQSSNPLWNLLKPPRWDFASGTNNYLAVHCDPVKREAKVVFHDAKGATLFDKTYAL